MNNTDWGGPYVTAACFCEHVLQERDGVNSVIRIVDRVYIAAPNLIPDGSPQPMILKMFIMLKSGSATGSHPITIQSVRPDGSRGPLQEVSVLFEMEDRNAAITVETHVQTNMQGLYWFEIRSGSALLTKVSVRIVYQSVQSGAHPSP